MEATAALQETGRAFAGAGVADSGRASEAGCCP
jgi:hypothetical protein